MKTNTRFVPVLALLGVACSQSSPADKGGGGTTSSGTGGTTSTGSGGKSTGGSGGTSSGTAGTTSGTGGGSGTGAGATGGVSASGGSGAGTAGTAGTPGTGGIGTGGAGGVSAGGSGGVATGGESVGGGAGSGMTAGQGQGGGSPMACPTLPSAPLADKDIIQFNDNGGWCWYQDERAVVDTKAGKFVIGSVASGGSRDSDQEVVIYDIASGDKKKFTLETDLNPDDHNAPAFFIRPDGGYSALWATHRDTCFSYYSNYDGTSWAAYKKYDWTANGCPWDQDQNPNPPHAVTYANPWFLSAESKAYAGVRSVSTSPALLVSSDAGSSWNFYGRLSSTKTVGYVSGYYKYWGNGTDRIDFVGTEAHPRDDDNSLWHGYYKGGKLYDSKDKVVDDNAGDTMAPDVSAFTSVFKTGTTLNGSALHRMWNHDIVRYDDGTIAITGQGRTDFATSTPSDSDPDKRMIYSRWDGSSWKTTYLVKAGPKLYPDEQDYTGLSAVVPDNPHIIFVSTTFDPRDDTTKFPKHEIFMGVTCDNGATFQWAPITKNSTVDNLRPIVPKWDSSHLLLLWLKGTYSTAQSYNLQVVGTTVLSPGAQ
ncbi:MAG TPA: hypothetical protein VGQ57_00440 [Polyangiaceae bacterium]|nr:hypothetical protein [Polyangiaceae bacterium]